MSKVRVPLHGKPHGYATVNTDATPGAVVGVNLRWNDGSLVSEESLAAAMQAGAAPPGEGAGVVYWRMLKEIPANIQSAAALDNAGFVRRDGSGQWSASEIVNDDLANASTDGLGEGANNLYFTAARARAAVGSVSGGGEILIQDGSSAPPVMLTNEAEDDFIHSG